MDKSSIAQFTKPEFSKRPYDVWMTVTKSYRLNGVVMADNNVQAEFIEKARVDNPNQPPSNYVLEDTMVEFSVCRASRGWHQ